MLSTRRALAATLGLLSAVEAQGAARWRTVGGALLLLPLPALSDSTRKMSGSVEEEEVSSTEEWLEDWFFSLSTSWSLACARK